MSGGTVGAPERRAPRQSHVGTVSLLAAVGGAAACQLLARGPLAGSAWLEVLSGGFEAAVVGALADWFAVTALFRHPLGLPFPHTAIIATRRDEITEGIANLVQNELLAPARIDPWLRETQPSALVLELLEDPAVVEQLEGPLRAFLRSVAGLLTQEEIAGFVERGLRRQLHDLPIDAAAGRWLARAVDGRAGAAAFEAGARSLARLLDDPRTRSELHHRLDDAARAIRATGKRLVPFVLRRRLVQRKGVEAFCVYASAELGRAATDPTHPLRQHVLAALRRFADRLAAGEPAALAQVERVREALLEMLESGPVVREMLARLQSQLESELGQRSGPFWELIDRELRTGIRDRLADPERRARFDAWTRRAAGDLIHAHQSKLGPIVRRSLRDRSTEELVDLIEGYVGADLQFIRLNGAVVGGFVGLLIAGARWLAG